MEDFQKYSICLKFETLFFVCVFIFVLVLVFALSVCSQDVMSIRIFLAPSGALVFILVYYISAAAAHTFSNFSNSSDSKVKVKVKVKVKGPNMCYIFEKHGIQGYQI